MKLRLQNCSTIPRVLVGWHVNVVFNLHTHKEEALLRYAHNTSD